MVLRAAEFSQEGRYRAMLELARQYDPKSAVREYVTNGLDALIAGENREMKVLVVPEQRRLMITDNGTGMDVQKLAGLPYSIGESAKQGMVDKRGEKGLGILAFASIGDSVTFLTREADSRFYHSLRMEVQNGKRVMVDDIKEMTPEDVARFYGVKLSHGTAVVMDQLNQGIIDKVLTIPNIKAFLSKVYTPALEDGVVMQVGKFNKRSVLQTENVSPIIFPGEVLQEIQMEAGLDDSKNKLILDGTLYFNPEGTTDKVMIYSKDVLVYSSLSEVPGFEKSKFWGCGKLGGFLNDNFSKLRLGRDGLDMNTRQFKIWAESLRGIESNLKDLVEERVKQIPRQKETATIRRVWETLADVYKDLSLKGTDMKRTLFIRAGVHGTPRNVIGASPLEDEVETPERKPTIRVGGPKEGNGVSGVSGGTFIEHSRGDEEKVARKNKKFALNFPTPTNFGKSEQHLRSKLDTALGIPTIYINSAHEDYKERLATGKNDETMLRYVAYLCSKEVGTAEAKMLVQEKVCSADEALHRGTTRAEEINFAILRALNLK